MNPSGEDVIINMDNISEIIETFVINTAQISVYDIDKSNHNIIISISNDKNRYRCRLFVRKEQGPYLYLIMTYGTNDDVLLFGTKIAIAYRSNNDIILDLTAAWKIMTDELYNHAKITSEFFEILLIPTEEEKVW